MTLPARTVIDEVKERLDITDVIGSQVELRRAGRHLKGLCPFHGEKTPSFVVYPDRGSYHCFGCGKSGDVISFLMDTENLAFTDALRQLAERAGVPYETPKPAEPEVESQHKRLHELNRLAARYYNHLLLTSPEAADARSYLEGRGIERATWEAWTLGYAPNSWDTTLKFLKNRGYSPEEILSDGLVVERTGGGHYDRFRRRIMFPIRDKDGNVVAFGGRAMGDDKPKYLNSPESPVFVKGEHLYGLDLAAGPIRESKQVVIVEGYVDAVVAHAYGFSNVVATLGTALTPAHVRALSKLTRSVCLALDADAAGDTAAMRGWEVLRDSVRRRRNPIRDSKGNFVASDSKMDLTVTIARLPRGEDPDTLIRKSPEQWRELIANARSVVDHFFETVSQEADLGSVEGRMQALDGLAPVVADIDNPILRGSYMSRLASLVGINEYEVRAHVAANRRSRSGRAEPSTTFAGLRSVSQEDLLLALLIRYPRLLLEAPPDFESLLEKSQNREVYAAMQRLGPQNLTPDALLVAVQGPLEEHVAVLIGLVGQQPELLSHKQPEELRRGLDLIRLRRLREQINDHSLLLKQARDAGDGAAVRALLEMAPSLALEVRQFDPPRSPYFKDSRES